MWNICKRETRRYIVRSKTRNIAKPAATAAVAAAVRVVVANGRKATDLYTESTYLQSCRSDIVKALVIILSSHARTMNTNLTKPTM